MIRTFREVVSENFPYEVRRFFVPAVHKGYRLFSALVETTSFLSGFVGKNIYPYLLNVAVEFAIEEAILINKLPIRVDRVINPKNGHRRLELVTPHAIMTISRVKKEKEVPRRAVFRTQRSMNNDQLTILDDFFGELNPEQPYYFILTHGVKESVSVGSLPEFVCLGAPEVGVRKWIDQIPLHKEPYEIILPKEEHIEESLPKLKEEIKKGVLGNGLLK